MVPVGLKTFAKRVEDLLSEFERAGNGKVIIEKLNPEPDSDAEDSAVLDGIEGQLTNTQEKFYLGLAVSFLDQKAALPVLAPDREQLLEYDITRAITRVASLTKPVVGIMSGLPVMGRPLNPMTKQQPTEPWVLSNELQNMFTVKKVDLKAEKIPDDIKVLLVIHPRDISETTEYALDQFILRGGKMIAFLDSYAYFDQQPDLQNPFGGNNAGQSTFYRCSSTGATAWKWARWWRTSLTRAARGRASCPRSCRLTAKRSTRTTSWRARSARCCCRLPARSPASRPKA